MTRDIDGNDIKVGDDVLCAGRHTILMIYGHWLWVLNHTSQEPTTLLACYCTKAPVRHKRWVNFYPVDEEWEADDFMRPHKTREEADKRADARRIACIPVEYEEGEGL